MWKIPAFENLRDNNRFCFGRFMIVHHSILNAIFQFNLIDGRGSNVFEHQRT